MHIHHHVACFLVYVINICGGADDSLTTLVHDFCFTRLSTFTAARTLCTAHVKGIVWTSSLGALVALTQFCRRSMIFAMAALTPPSAIVQ